MYSGGARRGRTEGRQGAQVQGHRLRRQGDRQARDAARSCRRARERAPAALRAHGLRARRRRSTKKRYVFIGKGITFDSGGISIKPAQNMGEMKHDMSGAANMVGLMIACTALKPNIEVHAIMSCAENMPGGNSYRPGDVWGSLDGKFVEIINTDAEGRLVLADALAYAAQGARARLPRRQRDAHGRVRRRARRHLLGVLRDRTRTRRTASRPPSRHRVSRCGACRSSRSFVTSSRAKSPTSSTLATATAGSITAALFLREFIGKTKNWVHADIAGPAQTDRAYAWHNKGATGHGVLTFLSLVERAGK